MSQRVVVPFNDRDEVPDYEEEVEEADEIQLVEEFVEEEETQVEEAEVQLEEVVVVEEIVAEVIVSVTIGTQPVTHKWDLDRCLVPVREETQDSEGSQ
ncbi:hypothetical protein EST38_g12925 [Candolleomyces aberdarensis]|uniref:Uncharacterized protein n=1 Tax=Candolleomyces aberdarensis TaxID=2316362 RepID=A0A4Q2D170_9AGAR|nr:hypothetical protein EST38_g12925 [Candolleomyces aberdarensis]